jgi:antitoxin PrlF
MSRAVSRLTVKSQTTVPKHVRDALGLRPGDTISYEIDKGRVIMRKQAQLSQEYLRALDGLFEEWASPADAEAYDDLLNDR